MIRHCIKKPPIEGITIFRYMKNIHWNTLTLFSLLFLLSTESYAQGKLQRWTEKIINKFLSDSNPDTTRAPAFFVLPALGYAQETGLEIGIVSSYNFYMDRADPNSRTSTATLMGTMTTEHQKNIKLNTDIWTKGNNYHILSELRYRDWPLNFYGIGNDTWKADEDYIGQKLARVRIDVEKKIMPNLYAGINTNYEDFRIHDMEEGGIFEQHSFPGKTGGKHLILGGSILYDTRNNTTYTTKGLYGRFKYGYAPNFFGKDNFIGHQVEGDIHTYHSFSPKFIVAIQGLYRGSFGDNIPYFMLRELGGDTSMRGYYLGRYRDKNYLTAQSEAKFRVHPRFAAVAFVGAGSTFSNEHAARIVPTYGLGLRYFFSLEHNSTLRFDYAFGEKRPGEQRQQGFYLSLSESF